VVQEYHEYGMVCFDILGFNRGVSFLLVKGWINPSPKGVRVFYCGFKTCDTLISLCDVRPNNKSVMPHAKAWLPISLIRYDDGVNIMAEHAGRSDALHIKR
jgi:hypothetical protein